MNKNIKFQFINFIIGNGAKNLLNEYNKLVKEKYENNENLENVLTFEDNVLKGSNIFATILINEILRKQKNQKLRTANLIDLEQIIASQGLNLEDNYVDTALVIRSKNDTYKKNIPLIENLAFQLTKREYEFTAEKPLMIPLIGLNLINANTPYGLDFELRKDAKIYRAPQLSEIHNIKRFSKVNNIGLPIFSERGRILYAKKGGISKVGLDMSLDFEASWNNLEYSTPKGRIVIVKDN